MLPRIRTVIRAYNFFFFFREFGCSSYLFTYKEGCAWVQHYISQSHIGKLTLSRSASGCCNAYYLQTIFFPMTMLRVAPSNAVLLFSHQAPQGVHMVCKSFPRIKIVTSEIELGLNKDFRVIPGMGEFGDRYFGTDDDDQLMVANSE